MVVSDIENPHFATMVRAIEDGAHRRGKRVLLCNTSEDAAKQASYLDVMAAERVLGVLISPSDPDGAEISRLIDLGIPVVAFDRHVNDPRADAVTADNVEAARTACRLLIGAGHRRIGFVAGRADVQTGDDRMAGYRMEMAANGLEERAAAGGFTVEGGCAATETLLRQEPRITALVVSNNQMTLGAIQCLRERGLAIPGDVALVAFDDPAGLGEPHRPPADHARPAAAPDGGRGRGASVRAHVGRTAAAGAPSLPARTARAPLVRHGTSLTGRTHVARIGLLSFSDGRDFVNRDLRTFIGAVETRIANRLEAAGHEVLRAQEIIERNGAAVREARRLTAQTPDATIFNIPVWAFPHFSMLAAAETPGPLLLFSNMSPGIPGHGRHARGRRRARPGRAGLRARLG